MNACRCGCGRSCRGEYARGHHPRSHEHADGGAPSQSMVLSAIRQGARTRPDLAVALGVAPEWVGGVLHRLQRNGKVVRSTKRGEWELTTT